MTDAQDRIGWESHTPRVLLAGTGSRRYRHGDARGRAQPSPDSGALVEVAAKLLGTRLRATNTV